ncbi:hypothetical protein [Streptomyces capoamus]|uniref:hypothetical protein n=1 Tax=Streptomyces capoamus TaxID=68183 RepID=UPI003399A2A6
MGPTGRAGLVTVGAALLAVTSGCSYGGEPCAGVGTVAGVGVMFDSQGYGDLTGASYELCARGTCAKGTLRHERISHVRLPLPHDVDPDRGPVRFEVTPEGGDRPVIDASADAKLTFQSDGCGGGDYNTGLAFTRATGLTTKIPKSLSDAWTKQLRSLATASPDPSAPS